MKKVATEIALAAAAEDGAQYYRAVNSKTHDLLYDIVGVGLALLKAQNHLCTTVVHRREPNGQLGHSTGLYNWIVDTFSEDFGLQTARNYMRAALQAGLTHESAFAEVEKLRKAKALLGRKLRNDLYLPLPEAGGNGDGGSSASTKQDATHIAKTLFFPFYRDVGITFEAHKQHLLHLPLRGYDPKAPSLESLRDRLEGALDLVKEAMDLRREKTRTR